MTGILLINLGTPASPAPEDVKIYLREFLMDPFVVDIPFLARWLLVNGIILRKRPVASATLYKRIWTDRGSPLMFHSEDFTAKVRGQLSGQDVRIELAMRYGSPSIESALEKLKDTNRVVVLALYPQYSWAATRSSEEEVLKTARHLGLRQEVIFVPPFYNDAGFLRAFAEIAGPVISESRPEHVLFSFHGIPERQIRRVDHSGRCLNAGCCESVEERNRNCYRAQCFATARDLAELLKLTPNHYTVCFQSRLGVTDWIKPYTDKIYEELVAKGVKRVTVLCPSFVADCLETLEEIALRGDEAFKKLGGEKLTLVPSLNATQPWVEAASAILKRHLSG